MKSLSLILTIIVSVLLSNGLHAQSSAGRSNHAKASASSPTKKSPNKKSDLVQVWGGDREGVSLKQKQKSAHYITTNGFLDKATGTYRFHVVHDSNDIMGFTARLRVELRDKRGVTLAVVLGPVLGVNGYGEREAHMVVKVPRDVARKVDHGAIIFESCPKDPLELLAYNLNKVTRVATAAAKAAGAIVLVAVAL